MADKGKGIADDYSSGKRKRDRDDKSGNRKRKNINVLQFFEDSAFEAEESDSSDDDLFINDEFLEEDFGPDIEVKAEPKTPNMPFFPKEEEMDEEEMEKILEERYKPGSDFVKYAEDRTTEAPRSDDRNTHMSYVKDPTIWKVKCRVGRERHSAFCLMQKYVDLQAIGTKLQILSAFAVQHVKGFIYIEAEKQSDIYEACKGLCYINPSRAALVPDSDVPNLFSVRFTYSGVKVDTWARVKNGKYKGDLAQVVNVNEGQKKVTVKLVPRIDLQAVAEKFGGGVSGKKSTIPAPRLITSSELDAYRVRVKYFLDRVTGNMYEVFEGMKLKDGYLFKKLALSSLIFCFSNSKPPSESELREFMPDKNTESNDVNRKQTMNNDNDNVGDGLLSSDMENGFQVPDLVTHGPVETSLLKKAVFYKKSDTSCLGGESFGCSEPEPPPEVSPAVGHEGLASFVEKLRSGAQELGGLMEEAATRCLGKVSLEDQLRGALLELELYKERVSAVEAERDTFCNSLKEERERVSVVEAERDVFCNSLKEEREKMVSILSRLLDTEVQLVTRLKEDLRVWCARCETDV